VDFVQIVNFQIKQFWSYKRNFWSFIQKFLFNWMCFIDSICNLYKDKANFRNLLWNNRLHFLTIFNFVGRIFRIDQLSSRFHRPFSTIIINYLFAFSIFYFSGWISLSFFQFQWFYLFEVNDFIKNFKFSFFLGNICVDLFIHSV
jgi:hypothetical protein